ncbi:MAG: hypothetical protein JNJ57_09020 [Saprospiraceae bacterium]|nr:hypothetical protein [Saprospiraceae bacterium]
MKMIILGVTLFFSLSLSAQNHYGTIGLNFSHFVEWKKDFYHRRATFSPGGGTMIGYFKEKDKNGKVKARYGFDLDYSTGSARVSSGGLGGNATRILDVKKITLGFNYYPLNFRVTPNFQLNFGARVSARILDFSEGNFTSRQSGLPNTYGQIDGGNRFFDAGILARAALKIPIGKRFYITPESVFLVGLTEAFKNMKSPAGCCSIK